MASRSDPPPVILTIDDEPVIRQSFCYFLEDHGYQVHEAENGRDGLVLFEKLRPDVVLVDLRMPEVDGLEVLEYIANHPADTPVIVISGTGVIQDVVEALHRGASDYLLKPVENLDVLKHAVDQALDRTRLLRQNRRYQKNLEQEVQTRTVELENEARRAKAAAEALRESEEKVRLLLDSTAEAIYGLDLQGVCTFCNPACVRILGFESAHQLLGRRMHDLIHSRHDDGSTYPYQDCPIVDTLVNGKEVHVESEVFFKMDGRSFPVEYWAYPIHRRGSLVGAVVTFMDITDRKLAENHIEHLAYHDALTGLPNRRLLMDRLQNALSVSLRRGLQGALIFLDLDHFKNLNDALGHSAGDLMLQEIAARLKNLLRDEDTIARIGGDEFVILLPELDEDSDKAGYEARTVAEKIRQDLSRPYLIANHRYQFTTSIGISIFPQDGPNVDDVLKHADTAMYRAKEDGRNTICFYLPSMQVVADERLSLEKDLRNALERNEFTLHYQPQVDAGGAILGTEALIRWNHPERGYVPPDDFIPVAEESGLILDISRWILVTALQQFSRWLNDGLFRNRNVISVNLSPRQFLQPDFTRQIETVIAETGVPPQCVNFEITESTVMANLSEVINKMQALKSIGVSFSVDDFGTGYSSLSYLKQLPLDELKIDRSFVRDISYDANDAAIVDTIIAMANHLNLNVIAEGVETTTQLKFLHERGCKNYQGYLFSRPLAADHCSDFLVNGQMTTVAGIAALRSA